MWQAPLDPKKVSSAARLKWFPAPFHSSGRPAELVKWLANRPKLLTDDWAPQHASKFLEDYLIMCKGHCAAIWRSAAKTPAQPAAEAEAFNWTGETLGTVLEYRERILLIRAPINPWLLDNVEEVSLFAPAPVIRRRLPKTAVSTTFHVISALLESLRSERKQPRINRGTD